MNVNTVILKIDLLFLTSELLTFDEKCSSPCRVTSQKEGRQVRFLCKCSCLEIYKEVITDLLNPAATRLHIREDFRRGIHVEGLLEEEVHSGETPRSTADCLTLQNEKQK